MLGTRFPEVLAGARMGDEASWSLLYDDLSGPLVGFLRGRGAPDPDDQVGETFLQVARNLAGFEGDEDGFRSWVFTIAHRRLVDALRHRSRRPVSPVATEDLVPLAEALDRAPDRIDELVDRIALSGRLEGLLAQLSDDQREVLVMRFAADLDATTVGELTGRSVNAVAAITRRALIRLREIVRAGSDLVGGGTADEPRDEIPGDESLSSRVER